MSTNTTSTYDPPAHFSLIHPFLYRSATFSSSHFPFLNTLHLNTIISLGTESPSKSFTTWLEEGQGKGVQFLHLGNRRSTAQGKGESGKDPRPVQVQQELIKEGLEIVLDRRNMPCLVMDPSGIYETGILVGCLRKLERWTLSAILAEYASHAGSKTRGSHEQFIELFDKGLVAIPPPDERVEWLTGLIGEREEVGRKERRGEGERGRVGAS